MEARLLSPEVSNSGQQRRPAGALEGLPEEPARSQMIGQVRVRVTPSTGWIFGTTSLPSSSSSRSPVPGTEFSCRLACGRWSDRGWHRRRPASPGKARPCSGSSDGAWPRMWERPDRPEPAAGSGSVHRMWFGPSGPCVGVGAPYLAARDRPKVCPVRAVAGSPRAGVRRRPPRVASLRPGVPPTAHRHRAPCGGDLPGLARPRGSRHPRRSPPGRRSLQYRWAA